MQTAVSTNPRQHLYIKFLASEDAFKGLFYKHYKQGLVSLQGFPCV